MQWLGSVQQQTATRRSIERVTVCVALGGIWWLFRRLLLCWWSCDIMCCRVAMVLVERRPPACVSAVNIVVEIQYVYSCLGGPWVGWKAGVSGRGGGCLRTFNLHIAPQSLEAFSRIHPTISPPKWSSQGSPGASPGCQGATNTFRIAHNLQKTTCAKVTSAFRRTSLTYNMMNKTAQKFDANFRFQNTGQSRCDFYPTISNPMQHPTLCCDV